MKRLSYSLLLLCCGGLLAGCGRGGEAKKDAEKGPEQAAAKDAAKTPESGVNTVASGAYAYLPRDTVLVAFIRPKQLIESEFVRDLKIADMQEEMQKGLPFPAAEMEELAMFVVKPDILPPLPQAGPPGPPEGIESVPFPAPEAEPLDNVTPPENATPVPGTNPGCDEPQPDAEPEPTENAAPETPAVFRVKLTKSYPEADFVNKWLGPINPDFMDRETAPQTYKGKKYLLVKDYFVMQDFSKVDPNNPNPDPQSIPKKRELTTTQAIYQADGNTWYQGSETNLKLVIDGQGGSPVVKELQKLPSGVDIGFAASLEGQQELRDYIKKGIEDNGGIPAPVEGLDRLPDELQAINGWVLHNAKQGDSLLQINLVGINPTAATNIQQATQQGMQMLNGLVAFLQFGNKDPKAGPMIEKLAALVQGISVTQEGATVAVKLPHPGGLKQLALELQPAIAQMREQAKLITYLNNLKQIGLALHNTHDTWQGFFLDAKTGQPDTFNADGTPKYSWRAFILPYVDQPALFEKYKLTEAWDSDANKALVNLMPDVYKTPGIVEPGKTGWRVFAGNGDGPAPAMVKGQKSNFAQFEDGTSMTILAVQVGPDKATLWTDPTELPFDPKNPAANKAALGKLPGPTFMVLFADGSVKSLPVGISPELLTALLTRNGKEQLTPEFLEKGGVDPSEFSSGLPFPGLEPPPEAATQPAAPEPKLEEGAKPEEAAPKPPEGAKPEQ